MSSGLFAKQVAVITGAGQGIGFDIASDYPDKVLPFWSDEDNDPAIAKDYFRICISIGYR
jgi:hypothetical protein